MKLQTWMNLKRIVFAAAAIALMQVCGAAANAADLAQAVKDARPGQVITLPAGTFTGSAQLPAGASIVGAGYNKTFIESGSAAVGVQLSGKGSRIENLCIKAENGIALLAENASDVTVRRVVVRGGIIGIRMQNVTGCRIENVVVHRSMTGILLSRMQNACVVNCTLSHNNSIAFSVVDVQNSAIFNNIITDAATGIFLGGKRAGLSIDYNLYVALFVGKLQGQNTRINIGPWRDVTGGYDAHSVRLPVEFASADDNNFAPVSMLDWFPIRATTADWGIAKLGGFKAPELDIDGRARVASYDLGVCEMPDKDAYALDGGTFTISSDDGTKSAGIFTPEGKLVRYLFQNLPLKKGNYRFVMPTRTQIGENIPAGNYEIRVVESNLRWSYRGMIANNGIDTARANADEAHCHSVRFLPDGSLLMGMGWQERGENLRSRNLQTGKYNWVFNGQAAMQGLDVSGDIIYCLRASGKNLSELTKINAATGQPEPWPDGSPLVLVKIEDGTPNGIVELDGTLYISVGEGNKLYYAPVDKPVFDKWISIAEPSTPAADPKRKLIWVVSGKQKLVALRPNGSAAAEFDGIGAPIGVAVNGDTLAAASSTAGKIYIYNCADPANLTPMKEIGRGDGPGGPIKPDRFFFQNSSWPLEMDLADGGRLAVVDAANHVVVFDGDKCLYESFAQFGNAPTRAWFEGDDRVRFFDNSGSVSWFIDSKNKTWTPDAHWINPQCVGRAGGNSPIGFFTAEGKTFGTFLGRLFGGDRPVDGVAVVRYENYVGRPVSFYMNQGGKWAVIHDANGDGKINTDDGAGTPLTDAAGDPLRLNIIGRWMFGEPDGSIRHSTSALWQFSGLDEQNIPIYKFLPAFEFARNTIPSVYDFSKTENLQNQSETQYTPDGGLVGTFQFRNSPNGMGFSNSGGVDAARFNAEGELRWIRPFNDYGPIQGIKPGEKFILTSWGHQTEWMGLDPDGLGLGHLGYPAELNWTGYWVDHPRQCRMFTGNNGKLEVIVGDYMLNCQHWFALENYDTYKKTAFPLTITADRAQQLAAAPAVPYQMQAKPAQPRITIPKLAQPLHIDGDLQKWRDAGIPPQIIITPVTAGGGIDGPEDASAIIRLAHLGQDLYVQVLRFDDVVTFHQHSDKTHLQDTVEMMLNGFLQGFQFSISRYTDIGEGIVRRRFYVNLKDCTPPDHAPRVVQVLDNASTVTERGLIEAIYGVDMSACKVIVTEFKLPIDKVTYKGGEGAIFPMNHGDGVWLGFMIDDNDKPGTDVQNVMVWPASYSTFSPKEDGAWAVFE